MGTKALLILCAIFVGIGLLVLTSASSYVVYRSYIAKSPITQAFIGPNELVEKHQCRWVEYIRHLETGQEQLLCHLDVPDTFNDDLPPLNKAGSGIKLPKAKPPAEEAQ